MEKPTTEEVVTALNRLIYDTVRATHYPTNARVNANLKAAIRKAFRLIVGRNPTDAEIDRIDV